MDVVVILLFGLFVGVSTETGFSDKTGSTQFYHWYLHEPFILRYTPPDNVTSLHIVWETPTQERITDQSNHSLYSVSDIGVAKNAQLNISEVTSLTRGVYICYVYNESESLPVDRILFGINFSNARYKTPLEKYYKNLVTAGFASAVFLFVGSVVVFTHACSYEVRMEKRHRHELRHNVMHHGKNGSPYTFDNPEFNVKL